MKYLSLNQPFAELVAFHGAYAVRKFPSNYRGHVLVVSLRDKFKMSNLEDITDHRQMSRIFKAFDVSDKSYLKTASVSNLAIAIGKISACRPMEPRDQDFAYRIHRPGLFVYKITDIEIIQPFQCLTHKFENVVDGDKNRIVKTVNT